MDPEARGLFTRIQDSSPHHRTVILGAGIVGSALAAYISESSTSQIILLDPTLHSTSLQGSTGHAPGFVGQLNEVPSLTKLAKASVSAYRKIPGGFDPVGDLEIASSPDGISTLNRRFQLAQDADLPAKILTSAEAAELAPMWHNAESASQALYFPQDGTANPGTIVDHYRRRARDQGVLFLDASAISLLTNNNRITGLATSLGSLTADTLILATNIWTPKLLSLLGIELPIVPVAHPYVHGPERPKRAHASPFVRWPERHVYARDHGSFDGFGSYDHAPIALDVESLPASAIGAWEPSFDSVIRKAMSLFPDDTRKAFEVDADGRKKIKPFNGIFAVTPDGLPLAGPVRDVQGLWVAAGVWITHAGGCARLVADMMAGSAVNESVRQSVDVNRFVGRDPVELRREALATYNNIYNKTE